VGCFSTNGVRGQQNRMMRRGNKKVILRPNGKPSQPIEPGALILQPTGEPYEFDGVMMRTFAAPFPDDFKNGSKVYFQIVVLGHGSWWKDESRKAGELYEAMVPLSVIAEQEALAA